MEMNQDAMELLKKNLWQDSDSPATSIKRASHSMDINVSAIEILKFHGRTEIEREITKYTLVCNLCKERK